jgi:hypothetical protein
MARVDCNDVNISVNGITQTCRPAACLSIACREQPTWASTLAADPMATPGNGFMLMVQGRVPVLTAYMHACRTAVSCVNHVIRALMGTVCGQPRGDLSQQLLANSIIVAWLPTSYMSRQTSVCMEFFVLMVCGLIVSTCNVHCNQHIEPHGLASRLPQHTMS